MLDYSDFKEMLNDDNIFREITVNRVYSKGNKVVMEYTSNPPLKGDILVEIEKPNVLAVTLTPKTDWHTTTYITLKKPLNPLRKPTYTMSTKEIVITLG